MNLFADRGKTVANVEYYLCIGDSSLHSLSLKFHTSVVAFRVLMCSLDQASGVRYITHQRESAPLS